MHEEKEDVYRWSLWKLYLCLIFFNHYIYPLPMKVPY